MTRTIGIIQARMSSSRLPGKILAPLRGLPLLQVLLERIRGAGIDQWWLATSVDPTDDLTAAWGEALGLRVLRGELDNVLSRFLAVLRQAESDWFLRVTADDPFVDAGIIDLLVQRAAGVPDSVAVVGEDPAHRALPLGYVPQLARSQALLAQEQTILAAEPHHQIHVLSWFYQQGAVAWLPHPEGWARRPHWRWTVDTAADYEMARRAFEALGDGWAGAHYQDWVRLLDGRPELTGLNQAVQQKTLEEG